VQQLTAIPLPLVRELSSEIFDALAEKDATQGDSICACALTLGRLMAPHKLTLEEEVKCVQDMVEWVGTYWASKGGVN